MALHASFSGKRVLITGGAGGLGRQLVERLCCDDATVFALDRDEQGLERLKLKFPTVNTICVDLASWEETKKAVETVGFVDHLVNNAGIRSDISFLDISPANFKQVFDINVRSMIVVSQVVAKQMIVKEIKGSIVNISSTASKITQPGSGLYSCTKSAVNMLTKSMAVELSPYNIRVNCICPAFMDTGVVSERVMRLFSQPNAYLQSRCLIKRFITADEAADLVLFLLSPLSGMITGSDVNIDAGVTTT